MKEIIFGFALLDQIKESDLDLIHGYIVQKKIKALERAKQKNVEQYYDDYSEALTGD